MALLSGRPILAPVAQPFSGLLCRVPTAFADDESLDLESLRRAVRLSAAVGVEALSVLGDFGEADRLTEGESLAIVRATIESAGSLPVVVDAVQTGAAALVAFARQIFDLGAAAIGVTIPMGFEGARVRQLLERLASSVALPIVLAEAAGLHRQSRRGTFLAELILDLPSVLSIRADPDAGFRRVGELRDKLRGAGRSITVLGRLEPFVNSLDASMVPDGVVIGLAFPEIARSLFDATRAAGSKETAAFDPSCAAAVLLGQETDPASIKEVLRQRRLFESNRVRHPGASADEVTDRYVRDLLQAIVSDGHLGRPIDLTPRPFLVNI